MLFWGVGIAILGWLVFKITERMRLALGCWLLGTSKYGYPVSVAAQGAHSKTGSDSILM